MRLDRRGAFLVAELEHGERGVVRIKRVFMVGPTEPLTMTQRMSRDGMRWAELAAYTYDAPSPYDADKDYPLFADAQDKLIEYLASYPDLHWSAPFMDESLRKQLVEAFEWKKLQQGRS